jgi:putative tricarboxylic transport membrane protein
MRRAAVLLPIGWSVFGCVILWQSLSTMDYFLVARRAPGPGFLPFWLSLGVVVLGALLTMQAAREAVEPSSDDLWPERAGWLRIGMVFGGTALALIAMSRLGFLLTSILFVTLLSYGLGYRKLRILLPTAVAMGVSLHILFTLWLRVEMPPGILGW